MDDAGLEPAVILLLRTGLTSFRSNTDVGQLPRAGEGSLRSILGASILRRCDRRHHRSRSWLNSHPAVHPLPTVASLAGQLGALRLVAGRVRMNIPHHELIAEASA